MFDFYFCPHVERQMFCRSETLLSCKSGCVPSNITMPLNGSLSKKYFSILLYSGLYSRLISNIRFSKTNKRFLDTLTAVCLKTVNFTSKLINLATYQLCLLRNSTTNIIKIKEISAAFCTFEHARQKRFYP